MQPIKKTSSSFSKRPTAAIALVLALAAILVVLAVLQYRWSGQVSEAEHERMQASLRASMDQFRFQLNSELQQLGSIFQPDTPVVTGKDWNRYAASCDRVLGVSDFLLVEDVYLWISSNDGVSSLLKLNRGTKAFEPTTWPADFEPVRTRYANLFSAPTRLEPGMGIRPFSWSMIHNIPLMLHAMVPYREPAPGMPFIGFVLLKLNIETMRNNLFPELAKKYFKGQDGFIYQVAVVQGPAPSDMLYKSDSRLAPESFAHPDAVINLLDNPRDRFGPRDPNPEQAGSPPPMPPFRREPPLVQGGRPGIISMSDPDSPNLELVAKHREGSLEAAVAGSRRRSLALSFGILLLLAVSMALIIVFARRAQRLAKLQIDFVAGVSHELRTPLAVICSAGDNLADGVVADSSGPARKYGELIRSEGRKLAGMIEQILAYASLGRGRRQYNLHPANINDLAAAVLQSLQLSIAAAGFFLDRNFDPDLPMINVDSAALFQAIQNLIQNALKYSGASRWLAIRTEKIRTKSGFQVRLTVEDRGIGIDGEDLRHIFEPFYRGGTATAAQIHGTGLGLFMVREAVNSMGGSITVKSSRDRGSAFTIQFQGLPGSDTSSSPAAGTGDREHAIQNIVDRG